MTADLAKTNKSNTPNCWFGFNYTCTTKTGYIVPSTNMLQLKTMKLMTKF